MVNMLMNRLVLKMRKIVDLAKKNRRLTVSMEKERSKVGKLAKEIERLQKN